MSGVAPDPLDRIAENARYAPNKPRRYPSWDEVDALVEVARAARETRDYLTTIRAEEGNPIFGIYERLDAALARLEGSA